MHKTKTAFVAAVGLTLVACGGGGGGGGGPALGDDARRMVLADIADNVILPVLRELDADTAALATAVEVHANAGGDDSAALTAARDAWLAASDSLQRAEVLQLGPAATSGTGDPQPGAMDIRDQIYSYPDSNGCIVDNSAFADEDVDASTRLNAKGMDALEYLLFFEGPNEVDCPPPDDVDLAAARADYAAKVAQFTADQASLLRQEWEPSGDDFRGAFANAGDGSMVYNRPQDALDALSLALFYVEKQSKDRKIACPTGIGASGLSCPGPDVSKVEYPNARASGAALRANYEVFRDVFQGVDGDMGINTLLTNMGREDLVQDLNTALAAALDLIDRIENDEGGFEAAIEAIASSDACSSAAGAAEDPAQEPTAPLACALQGRVKTVTTIFRADIVNALSLATPQAAAGDND